jgi:hypothetical protein
MTNPDGKQGADYLRSAGREDFRKMINPDLALYDPPMEMLDKRPHR